MSNNEKIETVATNFSQLPEASLAQGKLDEAYAACLKSLNSQPEFASTCKTLGDILQAKGEIEAAKNYYNKAIKVFPNFVEAHANLGSVYAKQKQWGKAIDAYEKALSIEPKLAGVHRNLAKVWQRLGKKELATEYTYQALLLEPESVTAREHLNLGNKLLASGQIEAAINCYRQTIKLQPNLSKSYQKLGEIFIKKGELESALVVLSHGIKLTTKNPRLYYLLGEVFQEQKQYDAAIVAYGMAIELKPDNFLFHKKLGDALEQKGQLDAAIACYQKAIEINPNLFFGYCSLGNIYMKQQRWDEAISTYRQATIINPNFFRVYLYLGNALVQKLQNDAAIDAYLKAIRLKPEHPWFSNYSILWKFLINQGQLQPVLNLYQNATKVNPSSVLCYVNLGEILTEIGKIDTATTCYQTACYNQTYQSYPEFVEQYWDLPNTKRPNFIIIGAQKSGTTSLFHYITQHPQVIPAIKKETHFWYRDFDKGINWYLAHFPPIPKSENLITGEATPNYLEYYHSAKRIYSVFPDVKLLVIFRNPIDRAVSQYYHWARIKKEERSLEEVIDAELEILLANPTQPHGDRNYWHQESGHYIGRSVYIEFIKKWMEIFPREQFLILKAENLYETPTNTMKQVFDFFGLPEYKSPKYRKFNSGYYPPMSKSCHQRLNEYFQPQNQRLEEYLGIQFNW